MKTTTTVRIPKAFGEREITTKNNNRNKGRKKRSLFYFCGAFKIKVPFFFCYFSFWASKKKSKEDDGMMDAEHSYKTHIELVTTTTVPRPESIREREITTNR